jgi:hypothetical protein
MDEWELCLDYGFVIYVGGHIDVFVFLYGTADECGQKLPFLMVLESFLYRFGKIPWMKDRPLC